MPLCKIANRFMNILSGFADISFWQLRWLRRVALFASRHRRRVGLRHRRADAAGAGAAGRRRAGGADHRHLGAVQQFQPRHGVSANMPTGGAPRSCSPASVPTCVLGAWGYTRLSSGGAALVIGGMLILSVPLRRLLQHHGFKVGDGGLAVRLARLWRGGRRHGRLRRDPAVAADGGRVEGAGVIATDAAISMVIGIVKISVFGLAGVITAQVVAFALLIGVVALPGAFLARAFVERMPVHVHTAILDAVVLWAECFWFTARCADSFDGRSRPLHHRRHRGQDRLDIAAGAQAEDRAAVVEQVEFDIAAAADQLLLALGLASTACAKFLRTRFG